MASFKPIRGIQENLNGVEVQDGQILFATDKKKIYIDIDTDRLLVGEAKQEEDLLEGIFGGSNWTTKNDKFYQQVALQGISGNYPIIIDLVPSDEVELGLEEQNEWSKITRVIADSGKIIAYCYGNPPTIDLHFQVKEI